MPAPLPRCTRTAGGATIAVPTRTHTSTATSSPIVWRSGRVAFAHTVFDHHPEWGALLDNLHVRSDLQGTGVGTELLSRAAQELLRRRTSDTLYLWVLAQNTAAQSFYDARGGTRVESELRGPFPGGGSAMAYRYHWPDPSRLITKAA